ncbi:MAG: hypothetical protein JWN93_1117 [Hyphomicrobiales bacterium]|nr:hypothetical protein [Hyphomicrobiales bacterium]
MSAFSMASLHVPGFTWPDLLAFAFFAAAWGLYHVAVERRGVSGLNGMMAQYRIRWMNEMAEREVRIVDSAIMSSLQNGTAFFASTSLLAIGASATLLRASEDAAKIASDLPLGIETSRALWETKVIGLLLIFGYAFFKFGWSYRLFNYSAILVGATPSARSPDALERARVAGRAARMGIVAARHFTRGQRAFFFALAYLGWFLGPWVFIAMTTFVLLVMWARQYTSGAREAMMWEPPAEGARAPRP